MLPSARRYAPVWCRSRVFSRNSKLGYTASAMTDENTVGDTDTARCRPMTVFPASTSTRYASYFHLVPCECESQYNRRCMSTISPPLSTRCTVPIPIIIGVKAKRRGQHGDLLQLRRLVFCDAHRHDGPKRQLRSLSSSGSRERARRLIWARYLTTTAGVVSKSDTAYVCIVRPE
jgi:hypothetical protein